MLLGGEGNMSYEGYVQIICVNGHLYEQDYYSSQEKCTCGAKEEYRNYVNNTNGDHVGRKEFQQYQERKYMTCVDGHIHAFDVMKYKVKE